MKQHNRALLSKMQDIIFAETPLAQDEFDRILGKITPQLPSHSAKNRKRAKPMRFLLIAAALVCCLTLTAFAADVVWKMTHNDIGFFTQGGGAQSQITGMKTALEAYNAAVGQSVTDAGITLTLDNIAACGNSINAFYTMKSEKSMNLASYQIYADGVTPQWIALQRAAGLVRYKIETPEQETLCENYAQALDYHKIDDNTLQFMTRIASSQMLPDKFTLDISFARPLETEGKWNFSVPVDLTDVKKAAQISAQDIKFATQDGEKVLALNYLTTSPFGTIISQKSTVTLNGKEIVPIEGRISAQNCLLTDNLGNTLFYVDARTGMSNGADADFALEYAGISPDATSVTFTPVRFDAEKAQAQPAAEQFKTFDVTAVGTKIATSEIGGYEFKDYRVEGNTVSFVLQPYGYVTGGFDVMIQDDAVTRIFSEVTNDKGETERVQHTGLINFKQDYKTGECTYAVSYYAATEEELKNIKTFQFYTPIGFSLDTAAAVTLPLS